jgi:MATE family multidrug resistance protein
MAVLVAGTAAFLWDGIYIGTTSTRQMLGSAVMATVIYFIVYYLFRSSLGNHALWLAYTVFLLSRSLYQTQRYPVVKAKV